MAFNLKSLALGGVAAIALLSAPLAFNSFAQEREGCRGNSFEQLNLTEAQTEQIETIRTDARTQMRSVLTSEQQTIWDEAKENGRRGARRELNLTDAQQEELRAIKEASREDVEAVLTPEQREQLSEIREQRAERRAGRRGASQQSNI